MFNVKNESKKPKLNAKLNGSGNNHQLFMLNVENESKTKIQSESMNLKNGDEHYEADIYYTSDSVVRRLRGLPEPPSKPQQQQQQQQQQQKEKDSRQAPPKESKPSKPKEIYIDRPVYYPITSDDNKKAIQEVEAFYQEKLKQLEEKNAQLQKITTEQFAKAVQEVEQKFLKHTGTPVCSDVQGKVYDCYSSNPKQTLNCWKEVGAFSSCVERARLNALARRG